MLESTLPSTGFVRLPTILAHYPVGASTWWRLVRDGHAPKPVKLGPATTAWRASDIAAFLEEKSKAAATAQAALATPDAKGPGERRAA